MLHELRAGVRTTEGAASGGGALIDASTQLLGVVGHPVAHSLSPAIHNAALRHDRRNAIYLGFDVDPDRFDEFVIGMQAAGARGLNVTLPHKRAAFEACTSATDDAQATEAVNTIVFEGAEIVGSNTDVGGVRAAVEELGIEVAGTKVLLMGAGGAGKAAAWALAQDASEILIANRTPARADKLRGSIGAKAIVVPWKDLPGAVTSAELVVNATSVGIDGKESPLQRGVIARAKGCRALLDLVYAPNETALVREARKAGIQAADGLSMLVHQAAEAYALFWGEAAPIDVMRKAALAVAGRT
jgi:shikimate dehydrogenase